MQALRFGRQPVPHPRDALNDPATATTRSTLQLPSSTRLPAPVEAATARLVRVENVSKSFGSGPGAIKALDDVSLTLMSNEFFTLLGPSGCGKTTLLRLLAGFEHPDAGAILLDDKHIVDDPPNKRPVNTVFQSYALFPHLTIEENVAFGLERRAGEARR